MMTPTPSGLRSSHKPKVITSVYLHIASPKPKDWLVQNHRNTFCRVLKVCLTAQVLRAQSWFLSNHCPEQRLYLQKIWTAVSSTGGLTPPDSPGPGTSVSLLCPCIHVSFLCHQVNPASAPETQELGSPVTSLGNHVWIICNTESFSQAQYSWYTGFTLWIWNIGDQDFLKAVQEQESGLGFSTAKLVSLSEYLFPTVS